MYDLIQNNIFLQITKMIPTLRVILVIPSVAVVIWNL